LTLIDETFARLRVENEAALIAYVTAGDPTPRYTPKMAEALIEGGADIIELGVPYSDPIADGPTIQQASTRALKAGITPPRVMSIAKEIRKRNEIPIVLLTYFNPVLKMGVDKFLSMAKASGVEGLVIPDLPFEEAEVYCKAAKQHQIDTIFLAAPSTPNKRLESIVDHTSGFLYLVGVFGVTGARTQIQHSTVSLVRQFLPSTKGKVPLAVGFGISTPEHVRKIVAAGADGAIVGSAFVKAIEQNQKSPDKAAEKLRRMTRSLKTATRLNQ
jgi:tryptophan synthase alpha chain